MLLAKADCGWQGGAEGRAALAGPSLRSTRSIPSSAQMTLSLTARERDALYEEVLISLSGIDDVWRAISTEAFDRASRVGREQSDNLRLILDDLGWGGESAEVVELTTPTDVLERVFTRIGGTVADRLGTDTQDTDDERNHDRLVVATCFSALDRLRREGVGE